VQNDADVVRLDEVQRHYTSGEVTVRALSGVSFSVAPGEFLALAGPSGSGKTTLLNLIGALDKPTAGTVRIEGKDLSTMSRSALSALRRDRLGFVFQAYNLIPVLSALENVEYVLMLQGRPAAERRERSLAILDAVGLDGLADRRPGELSGGQQQRVAVARAIVSKPALVLADEPTANLDSATGEALLDLMAKLNEERGATFIFSTHDPLVMERARRIVRLRDGRIESDTSTSP
jgi:putative ABC transport system ATP-binding protein